ncbi:hypothetical protein [Flectobacillus major]|uniref:hypothetical protein n=1 Tax=Flectobacillus major TaxID=103 RepID=UPI0005C7442D|nr:hypothetical protein [Flectobacillus major]
MKNIILMLLLFLGVGNMLKAQQVYVNGKPLASLRGMNYIALKAEKAWLATRLSVFLDYGQGESSREQEVTDADRKPLFFKSKVEIFNLLDKNGWDLVDTYEEIKEGKTFILHIFRRRTPSTK